MAWLRSQNGAVNPASAPLFPIKSMNVDLCGEDDFQLGIDHLDCNVGKAETHAVNARKYKAIIDLIFPADTE